MSWDSVQKYLFTGQSDGKILKWDLSKPKNLEKQDLDFEKAHSKKEKERLEEKRKEKLQKEKEKEKINLNNNFNNNNRKKFGAIKKMKKKHLQN